MNPLIFLTLIVMEGKESFIMTDIGAIAFYLHDKYAVDTVNNRP